MKLLDANIFIYAPQPDFAFLRPLLVDANCAISDLTRLEVLGFHRISAAEKAYYEVVFRNIRRLPVSESILDQAILLRQTKKMSLGDAVAAATAMLNDFEFLTRNVSDFSHIAGLRLSNPVDI